MRPAVVTEENLMATFQTPLVHISEVEPHPNADRLELANVLGYTCVVRKGAFRPGQEVVYLPEGGVVPEWLCRALNLWDEEKGKGRLAGKQGRRIKATRLRGTLSQGLLYPVSHGPDGPWLALEDGKPWPLATAPSGEEIADALGIEKYVPPVPVAFEGVVVAAHGHTVKFDIENLQSFPDAVAAGEQVVVTEKLHGTWTGISFDPTVDHPDLYQGGTIISSKGMSGKGLAFKTDDSNAKNLYVRMWRQFLLDPGHWDKIIQAARDSGEAIHVLGETFGRGVQDLQYGLKTAALRVFAVGFGRATDRAAYFLSADELAAWCGRNGLETVPELGRCAFSMEAVSALRDGKTSFGGVHVREGVVISPNRRRKLADEFAFVKLVSPDYLLRKGHATEFE